MLSRQHAGHVSLNADQEQAHGLFDYVDSIYAYVARRIGPPAAVEDIAAEVFAAALETRRPPSDALPWLIGIARRKVADAYRRRATRREAPLEFASCAPDPGPHQEVQRKHDAAAVRALVDRLDHDQREVILLFYVEELSARQIGVSMGRSEQAVNSLLQRARRRLRELGRDLFGNEVII
jgi:RNA polymerase sigma-70 factor (ECF subfamily)